MTVPDLNANRLWAGVLVAGLALFVASAPGSAQVTAHWTGAGGDNLYSNPDNWDLGGSIPRNDGTTYEVTIDNGRTVIFDLTGSSELDRLAIGTAGSFSISSGGALSVLGEAILGGLTSASGSGSSFTSSTGSLLGDARISVANGATVFFPATHFQNTGLTSTATIWAVDGSGSVLDLSGMQSAVDGRDYNSPRARTLSASNQGVLDLSGLEMITGAVGDDELVLFLSGGGTAILDALETIQGQFTLELNNPSYTLPSLNVATFMDFRIAGHTLFVPELDSLDAATFSFAPGAVFDAPNLRAMTSSVLTLDPTVSFTSLPLTEIDASRIAVTAGREFDRVSDTDYRYSGPSVPSIATVFSADGAGSRLDLSSLRSYEDGRDYNSPRARTLSASNQGALDLSGLEMITGAVGDDVLNIEARAGGTVLLTELGGVARLDGLSRNVAFHLEGANSMIEVANLDFAPNIQTLTASGGATLKVREGFVFSNTVESQVNLDEARLVFDRGAYPGRAVLEVGCEDRGPHGSTANNFAVGSLVIGATDQTVTLLLGDWEDNGNRAGAAECLYLPGLGGSDGIRVLNGSTMIIPVDVTVYAKVAGEMVRLNGLFGEGQTVVAFDEGFLQLGEASSDVPGQQEAISLSLSAGPNPSGGPLEIVFGLPTEGPLRLRLFDVSGREVRELIDAPQFSRGWHRIQWDGRDDAGARASSGVYFLSLHSNDGDRVRKITLLP